MSGLKAGYHPGMPEKLLTWMYSIDTNKHDNNLNKSV